jgi:hypothetical protein
MGEVALNEGFKGTPLSMIMKTHCAIKNPKSTNDQRAHQNKIKKGQYAHK